MQKRWEKARGTLTVNRKHLNEPTSQNLVLCEVGQYELEFTIIPGLCWTNLRKIDLSRCQKIEFLSRRHGNQENGNMVKNKAVRTGTIEWNKMW